MDPRPDDMTSDAAQRGEPLPPEPSDTGTASTGAIGSPTQGGTAPAVEPLATAAVAAVPPAGSSRARWLIGGGLAVAAVAAVALAASFLAASPLPEALKYLPRDSAVVVEIRPELPGDQRQHLGNLLAHFPGFEDQSTLDDKLDEVLDRITRESSNGEVDYATQVKPLLAGPMAVSITADALAGMMVRGTPDGILFVATTDGAATCNSIFRSTSLATTHRQVEIAMIVGDVGCAVHERFLLVGTVASIEDGLDARLDGRGVDSNPTYKAARAKLQGDQVASLFIDVNPLYDALLDAAGPLGLGVTEMPEGLWVIEGLRVTDDAVTLDAWASAVALALSSAAPTSAPAAESHFATRLPVDTLGYLELHGVGASVEQVLAVLHDEPGAAEALQALEAALLTVGGTDNLTGWIEDLGVAIVPTDDSVGAAILIRGTDAATAAARLTQIKNLLVLTGTGTDITMTETDHAGITITTVDFGDLSSLVGSMGIPGTLDGQRLEIAFAARDDLVVIAGGGGIVERILDVDAASSLTTSATYRRVIDIAGARNNMQLFVALDSTLALVVRFLPDAERDTWTTELKPYLDHLAGVAMTSLASSSGGHSRIVITVK